MSYCWLNTEEVLQNAEEKYHSCDGKEKAAEHYIANKDVLKEKARNKYRNLSDKKGNIKAIYQG